MECLGELGRVGRRPDGGGDEKVVLFLNHLAIESFLHEAPSCRVELDATMLCKELVECGRELIEESESLETMNLVDIMQGKRGEIALVGGATDATGLCAYLGWTSVAAGGAETNSSITGGREVDPAQKNESSQKRQSASAIQAVSLSWIIFY